MLSNLRAHQAYLFEAISVAVWRPAACCTLLLANTVTAYLLQQIELLGHRDGHGLSPWSPTGNRSAKPMF